MTKPFRPTAFQPFHVPRHANPIGHVPLECAELLLRKSLCTLKEDRLTLSEDAPLSSRLEDTRSLLHAHGHIGPPRRETMPVRVSQYGPQIGEVDRSAVRILGLWATKVHINGIVRGAHGTAVWLSRRVETSTTEPGTFDTLVAGGQAAGETELETAHKEAREEAGLTQAQLAGLRPVRRMPLQYVSRLGFHQELLVVYDLEVDRDFEPSCEDGEIDWHLRVDLTTLHDEQPDLPLKFSSHIVCTDLCRRLGSPRNADTSEILESPGRL